MKLASLRRSRALSIENLAEKSGVAASTISSIERGKTKPRRFDTVRKLAVALAVEPQQVEEFQHLVGRPADVLPKVPQGQWDALIAEIDKTPESEYLDFDAMIADIRQRRAKAREQAA